MSQTTVLITYPDGQERCLPVGAAGLSVGRAPDNDLIVTMPGVAPYHVVIRPAGEDRSRLCAGPGRPMVVEVPVDDEAGVAVRLGGYTIRLTGRPGLRAA
jgi:hypothetical protein